MANRSFYGPALAALVGLALAWMALGLDQWRAGRSGAATRPPGSSLTAAGGPRRVVSLGPSITETVFALGAGERIVGVDLFSRFPPAVAGLPRVGGLFDPNLEALVDLAPDLVLAAGQAPKLAAFCDSRAVDYETVEMEDLAGIYAAILRLGSLLGSEQSAHALAERISAELGWLAALVEGRPRPRTLLVVNRRPGSLTNLLTAGRGTFLDEAVRTAGGSNLFASSDIRWPQVSKEHLLDARPEVIIELRPGPLSESERQRVSEDWRAFSSLPAVENDRIALIAGEFALVPGPRFPELVEEIARALHPGLLP